MSPGSSSSSRSGGVGNNTGSPKTPYCHPTGSNKVMFDDGGGGNGRWFEYDDDNNDISPFQINQKSYPSVANASHHYNMIFGFNFDDERDYNKLVTFERQL